MSYHVHICNVGVNVSPSVAVTRSGIPIDKMYLLNSENPRYRTSTDIPSKLMDAEKNIIEIMERNGIDTPVVKRIDPWDFESIIDAVLDIASYEDSIHPDVEYHINFTSGTHVMAGAVCCAAFYVGADLYYVRDNSEHELRSSEEETKRFTIPSMPDVSKIKGQSRDILLVIADSKRIKNSSLLKRFNLSPSKMGYHTKVLKRMNLIADERNGNEVTWNITYSGSVAAKVLNRI